MDFKTRFRLAFLSLGLVLHASVMGDNNMTAAKGNMSNTPTTQLPQNTSTIVPTMTENTMNASTKPTVTAEPTTTRATGSAPDNTSVDKATTYTTTNQTEPSLPPGAGSMVASTTANAIGTTSQPEVNKTMSRATAPTMTTNASPPVTTNTELATFLTTRPNEAITKSVRPTITLSTPLSESSSSSEPNSTSNPAPPMSNTRTVLVPTTPAKTTASQSIKKEEIMEPSGLVPTTPAKTTAILPNDKNIKTEPSGLVLTTPAKTTAILQKDKNIKTFCMTKGDKEMHNSTELVNLCNDVMSHLKDGAKCSLTIRGSKDNNDKTIDITVSGSVDPLVMDQFEKETIPNDKTTLIAIITSCGAVLAMIIGFIIYASFYRKPYKKNHQLYLTEELQTVENGYHDNPTLEVEAQPEMQEKKVALNGEYNDCWIAPFDCLPKEGIPPEEEDTHL